MKVERNRVWNKYTFTPEDKEDEKFLDKVNKKIDELEEENKKLREFKIKREESMFYFKAQMERAKPKTAREAEDLQKAKEIFEWLYREELSCLEEENKKLREENKKLQNDLETIAGAYFDK